jgi:hypothetical protein
VPEDLQVTLLLDARPLPAAILGVEQPSDPGPHTISVSAAGYQSEQRELNLEPGQSAEVILPLTAAAATPVSERATRVELPQSSAAETASRTVEPAARSANHWPAYVTWGLSAAALGVGIGFGVAATHNKSDLMERCNAQKICSEADRPLLDQSHRNATLSTVGFSVAAAGAALGLVLYWLETPDSDQSAQSHARVHPNANGMTIDF